MVKSNLSVPVPCLISEIQHQSYDRYCHCVTYYKSTICVTQL